ncbi:MAG: hypothetical protein R3285_07980 [Kiloniellales bacterium]|nr:hypothetical protein [Kiloniellales bacterium]
MIPTSREIQAAIYGAWLLFRLDPRGLAFFEDSVEAFWRSFFAAVIVFPGFAVLALIDLAETEVSAGPLAVLLVELIGYVIVWVGFPLALYYLSRGFDRQQYFVRTVIALNWSVVVQIAIILPVHVIAASGILSPGLQSLAIFAAAVVTLFYAGFVVRTALEVSPPIAALVVAIDVIISLAVQTMVNGMLS